MISFLDTGQVEMPDDEANIALHLTGAPGLAISTRDVPLYWYLDAAVSLKEAKLSKVHVISPGWWLLDGPAPKVVRIVDHVACHLPNPLTGTSQASRGEAFLNMLDAYENRVHQLETDVPETGLPEVVMWHTLANGGLSDVELKLARSAGCQVASPNIAPWTVALRYEGIRVAASVICCK